MRISWFFVAVILSSTVHADILSITPTVSSGPVSPTISWACPADYPVATASGGWSGAYSSSGSLKLPAISRKASYVMTCSRVSSARLQWIAPTKNADGSALTNLAAYRIYYGTSSVSLSQSISLNNPSLVSYVVDNLTPATWYFAMTSVNANGKESVYSNVASKTIFGDVVSDAVTVAIIPRLGKPVVLQ